MRCTSTVAVSAALERLRVQGEVARIRIDCYGRGVWALASYTTIGFVGPSGKQQKLKIQKPKPHKPKPHACPMCGKQFASMKSLTKHAEKRCKMLQPEKSKYRPCWAPKRRKRYEEKKLRKYHEEHFQSGRMDFA